MIAGMAVVIGHNWPLFLHFRGGRGAATGVGVLLMLLPLEVLILAAAALMPLVLTGNVTLALAILFAPLGFVAWWLHEPWPLVGFAVALPIVVGLTHLLSAKEVPATVPCKNAPHPENGKY